MYYKLQLLSRVFWMIFKIYFFYHCAYRITSDLESILCSTVSGIDKILSTHYNRQGTASDFPFFVH